MLGQKLLQHTLGLVGRLAHGDEAVTVPKEDPGHQTQRYPATPSGTGATALRDGASRRGNGTRAKCPRRDRAHHTDRRFRVGCERPGSRA